MQAPQPILATELFPALNSKLIELLTSLAPEEWARPTVCAGWTVKDVASHLLDTTLRRLSSQRDGYRPPANVDLSAPQALVAYINRLNGDWVQATRNLSPKILLQLLEQTGEDLVCLFRSLDPQGPAMIGVSWAGEETSLNWFDIAREYTEKWHHQQQIRDATHRPAITSREFLYPVLDTFLRALPYAYGSVEAPEGTAWEVAIEGDAGGSWFLRKRAQRWELWLDLPNASARASVPIAPGRSGTPPFDAKTASKWGPLCDRGLIR